MMSRRYTVDNSQPQSHPFTEAIRHHLHFQSLNLKLEVQVVERMLK
ncbi:hypothetical protein LINPERPRIM_LOCUS37700 [Linum perenne]